MLWGKNPVEKAVSKTLKGFVTYLWSADTKRSDFFALKNENKISEVDESINAHGLNKHRMAKANIN